MSDTMTPDEIFSKFDWEGGTWECICGYGLDSSVLPEDAPVEVRQAWDRISASREDVYIVDKWLEDNMTPWWERNEDA